jgi:hypothetical protein
LLSLGLGILNHALAFALGRRRRIVAAGHQALGEVGEYRAIFLQLVAQKRTGFAASFGRVQQADGGPGKGTAREAKQAGDGFASLS